MFSEIKNFFKNKSQTCSVHCIYSNRGFMPGGIGFRHKHDDQTWDKVR